MSCVQNNLAIKILEEHFGDTVTKVGKCLLERGTLSLREIIHETKENIGCVKNSLVGLIEHDFVTFQLNSRGIMNYQLNSNDVISMLSYPQFIEASEKLFKIEGRLITEQILINGKLRLGDIVQKVKEDMEINGKSTDESAIQQKFSEMVDKHYIQRCSLVIQEGDNIKITKPSDVELYLIPDSEYGERPSKRQRIDDGDAIQRPNIYWKLNSENFSLYFRNQIIIKSIERKFDANAAIIVETMLKLMEPYQNLKIVDSIPTSKYTILNSLPLSSGIKAPMLEQYLTRLSDDPVQIMSKVDDHQGGTYSLRLSKFINSLTWAMIEKIIEERFSSKYCRIFRLLRQCGFLEQRQIETMGLIPPKDAKLMTYTLIEANLIHLHEFPQGSDGASKSIFLFCVRFPNVVRMLLQWCYKSLFNLKVAREFEIKQNKRLLEKKQKVNAIIEAMKSQNAEENQIAEVEEIITPPEKLVLENVQKACDKLESGEVNLSECILIFKCCIDYNVN